MTAHPPPESTWAAPSEPLNSDTSFDRLWRGFMTARVLIAALLLVLLSGLFTLGPALNISIWLIVLSVTYLGAALAVRLFTTPQPPGRAFDPQWVSTIGVDLLAFSALQFLQAGGINYSPLFLLPVLMASALGSPLLALGTAAGVTLLLLTDSWVLALAAPAETATRFLQAGLTGTGFFALAFMTNQLAARLAREENMARRSQRAASIQANVNQLVIETLSDGVLVVDARGQVHAANPSARRLLGLDEADVADPFGLYSAAALEPLAQMAQLTFEHRSPQLGDAALPRKSGGARRIHVRTRLTDQNQGQSLCVMFMEDLREMEARLRTEKLAAMGRMSAAVAHEFRNPLAAITQANALLDEDLVDPGQRQLSGLVRQNAQRLAQIVDEILNISRVQEAPVPAPKLLELDAAVSVSCGDWARQNRSSSRLHCALDAKEARVEFEVDHLRRVLVNLLDNALRYAGSQPDSIRISTHVVANRASLQVWSDGLPLEATVQRHLFEPFFSSESRSSGLGLYICRELCERHGALIGYRRSIAGDAGAQREGNAFFVSFRAHVTPLAGPASFDTMAA